LDRVLDDDVYDSKTDINIASLEHVEFSMATRLVPFLRMTYEHFELNDGETTYREYLCSYIIITREEVNGIYSSIDL
jgi:hypothetical protein